MSQLLRRRGRLGIDEAFPLIEQMATALDAAHRAQIVHRDFKSENVFLVEDPAAAGGKRAVVTDFGVARGADQSDRFAAQVTGLGIVGTPAYMAPEQVENKPITSSADLYALGIVIYEMVTGKLPFESPNPLTTAVKRLKEAPPPPHVHVPDLPAYWEKAILRCLEREPADRFATAGELVEALRKPSRPARPPEARATPPAEPRGPSSAPPVPAPPRPALPQPAKAPLSRSAKLGLVLLSGGADLGRPRHLQLPQEEERKGGVQLRRAVAVFGLKNLAQREDAAWISTAVAEMLSAELGRGAAAARHLRRRGQRGAPRARPRDLGEPDRAALGKLRGRLGCDYVVAGCYLAPPGAAAASCASTCACSTPPAARRRAPSPAKAALRRADSDRHQAGRKPARQPGQPGRGRRRRRRRAAPARGRPALRRSARQAAGGPAARGPPPARAGGGRRRRQSADPFGAFVGLERARLRRQGGRGGAQGVPAGEPPAARGEAADRRAAARGRRQSRRPPAISTAPFSRPIPTISITGSR